MPRGSRCQIVSRNHASGFTDHFSAAVRDSSAQARTSWFPAAYRRRISSKERGPIQMLGRSGNATTRWPLPSGEVQVAFTASRSPIGSKNNEVQSHGTVPLPRGRGHRLADIGAGVQERGRVRLRQPRPQRFPRGVRRDSPLLKRPRQPGPPTRGWGRQAWTARSQSHGCVR